MWKSLRVLGEIGVLNLVCGYVTLWLSVEKQKDYLKRKQKGERKAGIYDY